MSIAEIKVGPGEVRFRQVSAPQGSVTITTRNDPNPYIYYYIKKCNYEILPTSLQSLL